jgi:hypothetical protein
VCDIQLVFEAVGAHWCSDAEGIYKSFCHTVELIQLHVSNYSTASDVPALIVQLLTTRQ